MFALCPLFRTFMKRATQVVTLVTSMEVCNIGGRRGRKNELASFFYVPVPLIKYNNGKEKLNY